MDTVPASLRDVMPDFEWSHELRWALDLPIERVALEKLRWQLALPWWSYEDVPFAVSPQEVALTRAAIAFSTSARWPPTSPSLFTHSCGLAGTSPCSTECTDSLRPTSWATQRKVRKLSTAQLDAIAC